MRPINNGMLYRTISWKMISDIWSNQLWPNRDSPIETHSAMVWPYGDNPDVYSMEVFGYEVKFIGAFDHDKLIAVNSGHLTSTTEYRCRGLWVNPEHRRQGIAHTMFALLENHALIQGANLMWSLPRQSALTSYVLYGFRPQGDFLVTETSDSNIYVKKAI